MSTAAGHITLILDPVQISDADTESICNPCAVGSAVDPEHLSGKYLCTYQILDCPLCGRTSYKTRPKVRRIGSYHPAS